MDFSNAKAKNMSFQNTSKMQWYHTLYIINKAIDAKEKKVIIGIIIIPISF